MNHYRAVKNINEDSYGMDFLRGEWTGLETSVLGDQLVILSGDDAVFAYLEASQREIVEDFTGTGDIAIAPVAYKVIDQYPKKIVDRRKKKKEEAGFKSILGHKIKNR